MLEGVNYKFKFVIRDDDKNKYILYINKKKGIAHIGYLKTSGNTDITTKMMIDLDINLYNKFFETMLPMLDKWRKVYTGNINKNKWSVVLNEGGKETKYQGNGDYPKTWDSFISIISDYELIFKNDGKPYTKEKVDEIETDKELSIEYTVSGLGKFEKNVMSGLKEGSEFTFGNSKGSALVRVVSIEEEMVTLEFAKDLELGYPIVDNGRLEEKEDSYIVKLQINDKLDFDSFIPLYNHSIIVTGIFDVIKNYYE